ncbi:hypothetical protein BC830DRAFT_1080739 [Chytriomyces sp. MP71]|nr:hypothetical protein BC830DRAFT_1080739 [Chytriomyces sp. MP71]
MEQLSETGEDNEPMYSTPAFDDENIDENDIKLIEHPVAVPVIPLEQENGNIQDDNVIQTRERSLTQQAFSAIEATEISGKDADLFENHFCAPFTTLETKLSHVALLAVFEELETVNYHGIIRIRRLWPNVIVVLKGRKLFTNGPEASRARSDTLRLLKKQELDQLRETNGTIEPNWTACEADTEARKIVN